MKKVFWNCLIIAAITLTSVALTSCKSKISDAERAAQAQAQAAAEAAEAALQASYAALEAEAVLQAAQQEAERKNNDSSGVKLLRSIVSGDGVTEFGYDNQNRIVKVTFYQGEEAMYTHIFSYPDGDGIEFATPMEVMTTFELSGNTTININHTYADNVLNIMTMNKDGYLTRYEMQSGEGPESMFRTYQYKDGNMVLQRYGDEMGESVMELKYDDKKSPFYNCASPKWLWQWYFNGFMEYFGLNNNVTEVSNAIFEFGMVTKKNVYEYDSDGFPITRTQTEELDGLEGTRQTSTTVFMYRGSLSN
ncbi:MAG: hypothetical protein LBH05_04670 [Deferribacteraceae bacterium]|jgi:hypothetical protein|nr:hypothetical protein [Deferribacteraceae bacterium]